MSGKRIPKNTQIQCPLTQAPATTPSRRWVGGGSGRCFQSRRGVEWANGKNRRMEVARAVYPIAAHAKVLASAVRNNACRAEISLLMCRKEHKSWFWERGEGMKGACIGLRRRLLCRTHGLAVIGALLRHHFLHSKVHLFDIFEFKIPISKNAPLLWRLSRRRCHRILPMGKSVLCSRCASCLPSV